jgi:hypothetical protein
LQAHLADAAGLTPLHYAAAAGSKQLFDLLLQGKPWAAAAAGDSSSSSSSTDACASESAGQLLQLAVAAGCLDLVTVLLAGGELGDAHFFVTSVEFQTIKVEFKCCVVVSMHASAWLLGSCCSWPLLLDAWSLCRRC